MFAVLILMAALAVLGIAATIRAVVTDGYRRIPTRQDRTLDR